MAVRTEAASDPDGLPLPKAATRRHAFLIAAYDNYYVLEKLIRLLDDERNDVYLHVDRKAKGFDARMFATLCRHSRLMLVPRTKVYWGDYSQVATVLRMMRLALEAHDYAYLHLLSDSDLPLMSNDQLHRFCAENAGREFVAFNDLPAYGHGWVANWYPFNRLLRSPHRLIRAGYGKGRKGSLALQRRLGVDRTQGHGVELRYGSDWFSVTSELAAHLVSMESSIGRMFRHTFIPTEFYVQTAVWNSMFRERVHDYEVPYRSSSRLIDFARGPGNGSPLTWRAEHLDELIASDRMFARKFCPDVDRLVIDQLYAHLEKRRAGA